AQSLSASPPPLPYSPLFRSQARHPGAVGHLLEAGALRDPQTHVDAHGDEDGGGEERDAPAPVREGGAGRDRDDVEDADAQDAAEDRKSTRLNSSHVSISYAV